MSNIKFQICAALLAACLLCGRAWAAELPPELERASPEAAALLSGDTEESFGLLRGLGKLWQESLTALKDHLLSGVRSTAAIMAGVVLLGVLESAAPEGRDAVGRCAGAAGAFWITAVSAGDLSALIGLGQKTIGDISSLGTVLVPVLAAAEAAGGGVTAASVRQVAAVFFAGVLLRLIHGLLLPMVYLYIGVSAAGAVVEGDAMERIGTLLKKLTGWTLGGLLTLFVTYLAVSGAVAGAVDAQAVKLARSAVSAAVPVVGGILSEAAESLLAGAGILKGMVGTFGTLAVLGACLLPVLRLGCQYLLYQGASLVAAAAGPKKLTDLLSMLADAFGLVLAMTAASAAVLLIAIVSSLTAVAP